MMAFRGKYVSDFTTVRQHKNVKNYKFNVTVAEEKLKMQGEKITSYRPNFLPVAFDVLYFLKHHAMEADGRKQLCAQA